MGIETVFVALTLVETPRRAVAHFFPLAVSTGSEALITIARIQVHVLTETAIIYLFIYLIPCWVIVVFQLAARFNSKL